MAAEGSNSRGQLSEETLRSHYQRCVESHPGWSLGCAEVDFVTLFSPGGLELSMPGGELDPDDWPEEERESIWEDEFGAKMIFDCIKFVQKEELGL